MGTEDRPWISVHALGEWRFCPRAGVLAAASPTEPLDEEFARLGYMPSYTLAELEAEFDTCLGLVLVQGLAFVGTVAAMMIGTVFALPILVWVSAAAGLLVCFRLGPNLHRFLDGRRRRRHALAARPDTPAAWTTQTPILWWTLLKSGWEAVTPAAPYRDEALRLAGRPRRVLRYGDLRIPVLRLPPSNYHAGRFWVHATHELRLAAYTGLLEACEGGSTPCAVVLFADTPRGIAFPIDGNLKAEVERVVLDLQAAMRTGNAGTMPAPPERQCAGCPHGRPEPLDPALLRGPNAERFQPRTTNDNRLEHSACGDRFRWTPPHRDAKRFGLQAG